MSCRLRRSATLHTSLHQTLVYIILGVFCTMILISVHHSYYLTTRVDMYPKPKIWDVQIVFQTSNATLKTDIWHNGGDEWNDRILPQLRFIPRFYSRESSPLRYIYVPGGLYDVPLGQKKFLEDECLVDRCFLTTTGINARSAEAVLVQNNMDAKSVPKYPGQIWILWLLESPMNTVEMNWLQNKINWTATYRADSTIVAPYEKFVPFANASELSDYHRITRNYAHGKTKLVAWFVSNCLAMNKRMEYAKKLQKYITVDIFGACGAKQCPRGHAGNRCDEILQTDYKFYLAFENSNCAHYITEKLFWNALVNNVVPVVMGARSLDYLYAAPPGSYIHVDDFPTPRHLAHYLVTLNQDDDLYNRYFRWKNMGEFINTKFWCRLCAMLHEPSKPKLWTSDVDKWWRANGTCTRDKWDPSSDVITKWPKYT